MSTMNEIVDTGKCVACVAAGLVIALGFGIAALALVFNVAKTLLF